MGKYYDSSPDMVRKTTDPKTATYWLPSLRVQLFVVLIILTLSPVLMVGWLIGQSITERLEEQTRQNSSDWLSWVGLDIRTHIGRLRSTAVVMTKYPPIDGLNRARDNGGIDPLDGSTSELWKSRLEQLFAAHSLHPDVRQVRYLDETGMERVRVDVDGTNIRIVPQEELQDKSSRYYFQEAVKLEVGKCYVSPLDLNVEFGAVTIPHMPMIRVSTPVWYQGQLRGVIVINESPATLLFQIESAGQGNLFLADEAGAYLFHPDESKRWGNQLATDANLYKDWPGIAQSDRDEGDVLEEGEQILTWAAIGINPDKPESNWLLASERNRADFYRVTSGVRRVIAMSSVGLAALVASLALFLTYVWVRPLYALVTAAGRVREGDFSVRVSARRGDELGELGRAFNLMAEEVGERTTALEEAKKEAEQANNAKSVFLASMSHELRSPLNVILGFTQILCRESDLSDEKRENLTAIGRCGEHLLALINDILEMSKIEAGRSELYPVNVSLRLTMHDLEHMMRPRALEKSLDISFTADDSLPDLVKTDDGRLRQIMINLIGNAIKFTSQGSINVRASGRSDGEEQYVKFEVADSGRGMRKDQVESLFNPFVQISPENSYNEGTGLGLAISQNFARMMGGEIQVESTAGEGSTFSFEVIVEPPTGDYVEPATLTEKVLGLKSGSPVYRILIVEDNALNSKMLIKMLEPLGMRCRVALNGEQGVRFWETWKPDLILMDVRMTLMDGCEATRVIRSKPEGQKVPIIAVSASVFDYDREAMLTEGCDDFIPKPVDANELYLKLGQHLGLDFVYASEGSLSSSESIHGNTHPLSLEPLAHDLVEQLESAVLDVDLEKMSIAIDAIGSSEPAIAIRLNELVGNYNYDHILNCVDKWKAV